MNLSYSTAALIDMDRTAQCIQSGSRQAALRFLESVEKTAERLASFPEFGAVFESPDPELQDLRACLVIDFNKYLMFYRIKGESIIVTRIIHGHRNIPEVLKDRL